MPAPAWSCTLHLKETIRAEETRDNSPSSYSKLYNLCQFQVLLLIHVVQKTENGPGTN